MVPLVVVALLVGCQDQPIAPPDADELSPPAPTPAKLDEDRTPFQRMILGNIGEREVQGLPVPSDVAFEYAVNSASDTPKLAAPEGALEAGEQLIITATTVIHFDSPAQAGYEEWPAFVVEGEMPPEFEGFINEGDYSQFIRDKVEEESPGFWEQYKWGNEPRTYTISETYTVTYPGTTEETAAASPPALSNTTSSLDEILMGFTAGVGPEVDYDNTWTLSIPNPLGGDIEVASFRAWAYLDWGLGLRLPMEVSLISTDLMEEGSTYWSSSSARGLNWLSSDFAQAGVDPQFGNEFVMYLYFDVGASLSVFGVDIIGGGLTFSYDASRSFTTPFGPGSFFPIPSIDIPIFSLDVGIASGSVDFRLTPLLGSTQYTADWQASDEASGSGSLTYTDPTIPVQVGLVTAIDGPGLATITLDEFRYHFNQFLLNLSLYIYLGLDLGLLGEWDWDWNPHLLTVNLSDFVGWLGLYVGVHASTPDALTTSIPIQNVAPTAEIDRTGAQTINGITTFLAHAGDPLTFTGQATDPGLDDLTLSWDWNDGPPSPDVSTTYPVPYDVTESQTHAFDEACVYLIRFAAVDDDGAEAVDQVAVVIAGGLGNWARSEGYWQHQLRGNGRTDFDAASLECYLAVIGHMSAVFNEARDASTIEAAHDVLFLKKNGGRAIEQLDRELLVVWLNFVNGAVGYTQLVDTDEDYIPDTPFVNAVAAAESVRLDPFATVEEIKRQTEIVHHITETLKE
jgi:hypothetical protein